MIDLGSNFLEDVAGVISNLNYLGTIVSALKISGKMLVSNSAAIKKLEQKLSDSFYTDIDKANIHYLTRINRVARIRGDI